MTLTETVKPFILHYGYFAVVFGVFFESIGLPLPGETLIIVAGFIAAQGILNLAWVMIFAILATFIANNISYAFGFYGGRKLVSKYGHYVFIDQEKIKALENFVQKHGCKVLVIARFILGLRQFNGLIAGLAKMQITQFIFFNLIGAILWVGCWSGLAYCLGRKSAAIFIQAYFLFGVISLLFLFLAAIRISKGHKH